MRAAVADAGRLSMQESDVPEPGAEQVLVRPLATGICGSDLPAMQVQAEDPVTYPPMVLGHEFCAEVLAVGLHAVLAARLAPGGEPLPPSPLLAPGHAGRRHRGVRLRRRRVRRSARRGRALQDHRRPVMGRLAERSNA